MSINENNLVIIGRKPTMNYVIACVTLFNSGNNKIFIKARGRAITRAIETVEMLRKSFMSDLEVEKIDIGSQEYEKQGKIRTISTIQITILKPIKTFIS